MSELTIDELARETGMTVRNVRAHQSRGLLPPPEVRARTGYYGPEHVARLRLIQELQANGYNLAAIKHLLSRAGGSAEEVLSFARTLLTPYESETPEIVEVAELAERFGEDPKLLDRARKAALVVPLGGGRYEVPSPTLLRAGEALASLDVPREKALDSLEQIARRADDIAETFVKLFIDTVWKPFTDRGEPEEEWPRVREALERLRPLATDVLVAVFHQRMTEATEDAFGRELAKRAKR